MTFEEAKDVFINRGFVNGIFDGDKWRESVFVISKWLEQEPCEDAVSRKAVHDMLENLPITVEDKWFNWLQKACMRLAELPLVTPQESVLNKIRNEIDLETRIQVKHYANTDNVIDAVLNVIDEYKAESVEE